MKKYETKGRKKLTMQRIIRKSLVAALGTVLDPAKGIMYISSEYEEVMLQMRECILNDNSHCFRVATMEEIEHYISVNPQSMTKLATKKACLQII